jgi:hypothetical protein
MMRGTKILPETGEPKALRSNSGTTAGGGGAPSVERSVGGTCPSVTPSARHLPGSGRI